MNGKERKTYQQQLTNEGFAKWEAFVFSWRGYLVSQIPFSTQYIAWLDRNYYDPIMTETDLDKLRKVAIRARVKFLVSYPLYCISLAPFLFGSPALVIPSALFSTYLNNSAETEENGVKDRLKQLGLTRKDLFHNRYIVK